MCLCTQGMVALVFPKLSYLLGSSSVSRSSRFCLHLHLMVESRLFLLNSAEILPLGRLIGLQDNHERSEVDGASPPGVCTEPIFSDKGLTKSRNPASKLDEVTFY